ncbi:hypothetical protein K1719_043087 [Acacia pycnantha]|nr:hypothetical protein K1719_043087 [Acacia pycnantha]
MAQPPSQHDNDDKHQLLIDEVIPLFMKCGLPKTCLDPQTRLQFGYTTSILAKLLRRFRPLDSAFKRERALLIGVNHGFFSKIQTAQPSQFYDFLEFLKTPQGQQAWQEILTYEKLSRKACTAFSPQEIGWLKVELQQWIEKKVAEYDTAKDSQSSKRLRSLLGAMGLSPASIPAEPLHGSFR